MSAPPAPQPVHVSGGTHGITAQCDELVSLATAFGSVAAQTLLAAADLHSYLVNPAVTASAPFDPGGWTRFEHQLVDALDGSGGLSWIGLHAGFLDNELHLAAAGYRSADQLDTGLRDHLAGALRLPGATTDAMRGLLAGEDPMAVAQRVVTDDPQLADAIVNDLAIPPLLIRLGGRIPDGHGVAHSLGVDGTRVAAAPPRHLGDVVGELGHRNSDPHHGAIDVRILSMADGSRRVIVDITGTKSWTMQPTDDVTSLATNARALVGRRTAYEQGVLAAMRDAGVRSTDQVMLVGHSQGGMVAVDAAADASRSREFRITHVVTAGSPIGMIAGRVPSSVKILALENTRDLVPHLDGRTNPDRPNVTTVSSGHGDHTIGGDHEIGANYVPLARDADATRNASVRDFETSARDYLRGTSVTTHAYQVKREY